MRVLLYSALFECRAGCRTLHKQGADADQKRYITLFSFTCCLMVSQVFIPAITVRGFNLLEEANM